MESNAPDSEQRILQAAKQIFAQQGFGGARIDKIAKLAGINKAMIYYHFKSKEELYFACIDSIFQEKDLVPTQVADTKEISNFERLIQLIESIYNRMDQDRLERCSIIARELVSRGNVFQMMRDRYWIPSYKRVYNTIEAGIQSGEFIEVDSIDFITFTIISHITFYKISQVTYSDSELYLRLYPDGGHAKMKEYLVEILKKILLKA